MKNKLFFILTMLFSTCFISAQVKVVNIQNTPSVDNPNTMDGWELVWSDEFNGASLSTTEWEIGDKKLNDEIYLDGNWPIDVSDGSVKLSVEKFSIPVDYISVVNIGTFQNPQYVYETSAFNYRQQRVRSVEKFDYGYFEMRCKIPVGKGLWPAFWLFDNDNNIPMYNEIDIFENFPENDGSRIITSNLHVDDQLLIANGQFGQHEALEGWLGIDQYYLDENDLNEVWHTFSCEWGLDEIKWYLNNKLIKHVHKSDSPETYSILSKLILDLQITMEVSVKLDKVTHSFPALSSLEIDYVRVYKKKPELTITGNCNAGVIVYVDENDPNTYTWTVTGGVEVNSVDNWGEFEFALGSESMEICVTATNNVGHQSSTCITYPSLDPSLNVTDIVCDGGDIKISVQADFITPGSWWGIYHADVNGNIIDWNKINPNQAGSHVTFENIGLTYGNDYVIAHGVWGECTSWTVSFEHVKLTMADFEFTPTECGPNGIHLDVVSSHQFLENNEWDLFYGDENGNIINTTPIATKFGHSSSFENLQAETWYVIRHGIWGACAGSWKESRKSFYAPSFHLNSEFNITVDAVEKSPYVSIVCSAVEATSNSEWSVYHSNSSGDILSLAAGPLWGQFSYFTPAYNLLDNEYYVVTHGVWSECSNWQWSAYLVNGSSSNPVLVKSMEENDLVSAMKPDNADISILPNPTAGVIRVNLESIGTGWLILSSAEGRMLKTISLDDEGSIELDLSEYPDGIYFVQVSSANGKITKKIIKE